MMKKKLELKKEVVARLDDDQMKQMMGGKYISEDIGISCLGTCNTRTCGTDDTCANSCRECWPIKATDSCDCPIIIDDSNLAECWK